MDFKIIFYCIVLIITTFFIIKYFILISPKIGLVDIPNDRSSHKKPTPRGAGIVIGLMFFLSMFIFEFKLAIEIIYPMIALLIVFICGVVDDLKTLGLK